MRQHLREQRGEEKKAGEREGRSGACLSSSVWGTRRLHDSTLCIYIH